MTMRRVRLRPVGVVLALLLLGVRALAPVQAMPPADGGPDAALVRLVGDVPICHGGEPDPSSPLHPAVPMHDCALCPACQVGSMPALPPASAPTAAPPRRASVTAVLLPHAIGPPRPDRAATSARGPPNSPV